MKKCIPFLFLVFMSIPGWAQTESQESEVVENNPARNGYFSVGLNDPSLMLTTYGEPLFSPTGFSATVGWDLGSIEPFLSFRLAPAMRLADSDWGVVSDATLGSRFVLFTGEQLKLAVSGGAMFRDVGGFAIGGKSLGPYGSVDANWFFSKHFGLGFGVETGYLFGFDGAPSGLHVTPNIGIRLRF